MHQTIPAVFEQGVFRPLKKIRLKEHQRFLLKLQVPKEDYDSLLETIEILGDRNQIDRIQSALRNVKKDRLLSHEDIFGHPQPNL